MNSTTTGNHQHNQYKKSSSFHKDPFQVTANFTQKCDSNHIFGATSTNASSSMRMSQALYQNKNWVKKFDPGDLALNGVKPKNKLSTSIQNKSQLNNYEQSDANLNGNSIRQKRNQNRRLCVSTMQAPQLDLESNLLIERYKEQKMKSLHNNKKQVDKKVSQQYQTIQNPTDLQEQRDYLEQNNRRTFFCNSPSGKEKSNDEPELKLLPHEKGIPIQQQEPINLQKQRNNLKFTTQTVDKSDKKQRYQQLVSPDESSPTFFIDNASIGEIHLSNQVESVQDLDFDQPVKESMYTSMRPCESTQKFTQMFDVDQKNQVFATIKAKNEPKKPTLSPPSLKMINPTDESTYFPRKSAPFQEVRDTRYYDQMHEMEQTMANLDLKVDDYKHNKKIISQMRQAFADNVSKLDTSEFNALVPDSKPGNRKPDLLKVNRILDQEIVDKNKNSPPKLNDRQQKTCYQFEMHPKFYQANGLKYSEISAITNDRKRKFAQERGFMLPPLGGKPYNATTQLSDFNKRRWTSMYRENPKFISFKENPPVDEKQAIENGMEIASAVKERQKQLDNVMQGTTGDLGPIPETETKTKYIKNRTMEINQSFAISLTNKVFNGLEKAERNNQVFKSLDHGTLMSTIEMIDKKQEAKKIEAHELAQERSKITYYGEKTRLLSKAGIATTFMRSLSFTAHEGLFKPSNEQDLEKVLLQPRLLRQPTTLYNIIQHHLDPFQQVVYHDQKFKKTIGKQLVEKIEKQKEIKKLTMGDPSKRDLNNPSQMFMKGCTDQTTLSFPVMNKVRGKTLCLQNYKMRSGQITALANTCMLFDEHLLNRVFFENCGLTDSQLAEILTALGQIPDFKSLIYKHNEFGEQSLVPLQQILRKRLPLHLEKLSIISCKGMTMNVCKSLLELLIQKSQLKVLNLSGTTLNDQTVKLLTEYVKQSRNLERLDLSYTRVASSVWSKFLIEIKSNFHLTFLSLANNQIMSNVKSHSNAQPYHQDSSQDSKTNQKQPNEALEALKYFIKRNYNLKHVDLSNCNLDAFCLREIISCLPRCQSLRAIHLCYNPGILSDPELIPWALKRARCKPLTKVNKIDLPSQKINDESEKLDYETFEEAQVMANYTIKKYCVQNPITNIGQKTQKLIFQRWIGHRSIFKRKGQWQILTDPSENCWVCDMHRLTIILYQDALGNSNETEVMQNFFKAKYADHNHENTDKVTISGEFTNWEPKPMIKLTDLLQKQFIFRNIIAGRMNRETTVPIIYNTSNPAKTEGNLNGQFADVTEEESNKEYDEEDGDKSDWNQEQTIPTYKYGSNWRPFLMELLSGYKYPTIVNGENLVNAINSKSDPIYIYFEFTKPGKHYYVVNTPDKDRQPFYVNHFLVKHRHEEIPPYLKKTTKMLERTWNFDKSVFASFKLNSNQTWGDCYSFDSGIMKVRRLIGKDAKALQEYLALDKYLRANYKQFVEAFKFCLHYGGCVSMISRLEFKNWCKAIGIVKPEKERKYGAQKTTSFLDRGLTRATTANSNNTVGAGGVNRHLISLDDIERCFIAANRENVEIPKDEDEKLDNPESELVRYEFTECMIRIADQMYKKKNLYNNIKDSIERLMEDYVIPFMQTSLVENWGGPQWRQRELYNLPINDLIMANMDNLKQLFEKMRWQDKPGVKYGKYHYFMAQDAISMCDQSELGLNQHQIRMVFGMSKQTVVKDNDQDGQQKLVRLVFVEFLEFIGRISAIKFMGTEMEELSLCQKIAYIMDDLFPIINAQRHEVVPEQIEVSESDEDY